MSLSRKDIRWPTPTACTSRTSRLSRGSAPAQTTRARRSCWPSARSAGFSPDLRHHCTEWDAVASLVAAGAGVALIPRLAQPLRQTDVVVCPVIGTTASRLIFAAVRAGAQNDPSTAAVLAQLKAVAAARPDSA